MIAFNSFISCDTKWEYTGEFFSNKKFFTWQLEWENKIFLLVRERTNTHQTRKPNRPFSRCRVLWKILEVQTWFPGIMRECQECAWPFLKILFVHVCRCVNVENVQTSQKWGIQSCAARPGIEPSMLAVKYKKLWVTVSATNSTLPMISLVQQPRVLFFSGWLNTRTCPQDNLAQGLISDPETHLIWWPIMLWQAEETSFPPS